MTIVDALAIRLFVVIIVFLAISIPYFVWKEKRRAAFKDKYLPIARSFDAEIITEMRAYREEVASNRYETQKSSLIKARIYDSIEAFYRKYPMLIPHSRCVRTGHIYEHRLEISGLEGERFFFAELLRKEHFEGIQRSNLFPTVPDCIAQHRYEQILKKARSKKT